MERVMGSEQAGADFRLRGFLDVDNGTTARASGDRRRAPGERLEPSRSGGGPETPQGTAFWSDHRSYEDAWIDTRDRCIAQATLLRGRGPVLPGLRDGERLPVGRSAWSCMERT